MESTQAPRTVVITGGGTGIGKAIAAAFARHGDRIVLLGRRVAVLAAAAEEIDIGATVLWRRCDVSIPVDVDETTAWLRDEVETVDVLVNNAGAGGRPLRQEATTAEAAEQAERLLRANLIGTWLMTHAVRKLLRRPGGRIVNISSVAAHRGGTDMYSAAKAGVLGLTRAVALQLGMEGITVNAIAPGIILQTEFFGGEPMSEKRRKEVVTQTALGRTGLPEDVAAAALYLASPEASFVTGEVLNVNGGWHFS